MGVEQISIYNDSHFIVKQVIADGLSDFSAKDSSMLAYLSTTHQQLHTFFAHEIRQMQRTEDSYTNALARLASAINDENKR